MPRLRLLLLTLILGAGLAAPAFAQWKWKDKDGRIQYSDVPPPPTVKETDILQKPASARRAAVVSPEATASAAASAAAGAAGDVAGDAAKRASPPAARPVDPELEARRKKTEELEAAKKKQEMDKQAAARKDNCTQARNYMKTLEEGIRISRTSASGEREILDDAGRAQETKRTQAIIASDCK